MSMPRKCPSLDMTNLYSIPGTADAVHDSLKENPQAAALFAGQIAFSRCELDKANEYGQYLLECYTDFDAIVGGSILLCLNAVYKADTVLYRKARTHMFEASYDSEKERQLLSFWFAVASATVREAAEYPDWFQKGRLEYIPEDSYPAVRFHYAKLLVSNAHKAAFENKEFDGMKGLELYKSLPYILEPMVSQAVMEKTLLPEILLRLMCASVYHDLGKNDDAIYHIDKAIELSLPDRLFMPLLEFRFSLGYLLDERIARVDEAALKRIKELYKELMNNWLETCNLLSNQNIAVKLTDNSVKVLFYIWKEE